MDERKRKTTAELPDCKRAKPSTDVRPSRISHEELTELAQWYGDELREIRAYIVQPQDADTVHLMFENNRFVSVERALVYRHANPPEGWETLIYPDADAAIRVIIHMKWGYELGPTAAVAAATRPLCQTWNYKCDWLNAELRTFFS